MFHIFLFWAGSKGYPKMTAAYSSLSALNHDLDHDPLHRELGEFLIYVAG